MLKTALVCIANSEERYIGEWTDYHLKLGFSDIFIFQNNWRVDESAFRGIKRCSALERGERVLDIDRKRVHLCIGDGDRVQERCYDRFIREFHKNYDFGCFFDVDEFLCLKKHDNVSDFLSEYIEYKAVGINWRLFGNSGLTEVNDSDYSLVGRFVRCGSKLNRHIKTCINFKLSKSELQFRSNPHFVGYVDNGKPSDVTISADKKNYVTGPFNGTDDLMDVQLNHYYCKTDEEFIDNKIPKSRCDIPRSMRSRMQGNYYPRDFDSHNENDVVDLTALEFYFGEDGGDDV